MQYLKCGVAAAVEAAAVVVCKAAVPAAADMQLKDAT
jgi:hypothetical protein